MNERRRRWLIVILLGIIAALSVVNLLNILGLL
jgi:hypothetical protein